MRVLSVGNMYPPHHQGGYEVIWRSCVRHLRARGHQVRVLTTGHREPNGGGSEDADVHRELRWYWRDHEFARLSGRTRLAIERHNARVLTRHLRELEPEVVSWWAMGGMSLSLIERVRRAGLPALGVVCDDWLVYGPQMDAWLRPLARRPRLRRPVELLTGAPGRVDLDRGAAWVFISDHTRRRASLNGASRSEVAHAGIDPQLYRPAPPRPWGWRLLYAGRIDPRKGIATAIEALPLLPAAARLTVTGAGDAAHLEELRRSARGLGVGERVDFRPPRDQAALAREYAAADALVFPVTWAEPWGLVPLEAMASGTPVVATGTGGSGEYLEDGRNCLLFPPRDAPALAAALERLAGDAGLRARLRAAGLATAARYSDAAFNERVEAALLREAAR
jgi:glycogen synthase